MLSSIINIYWEKEHTELGLFVITGIEEITEKLRKYF